MAPASRHFLVRPIGRGVYAAIATPAGYGLCNATIVDLGGRTVVFDTMLTPAAGADLARAAERLTGRRPDWVVNSHWHGDHIWGNASFPDGHIVSSRGVREQVVRRSRQQFRDDRREFRKVLRGPSPPGPGIPPNDREQALSWFLAVVRLPRSHRIVPPELTFEGEMELTGSRRSVRLITYGGGHSPSDVFAFLPDERIVLAGDLVMVGLHPSVSDGWPDRWTRILGRVQRLRPDRVVPGHGPVGSGRSVAVAREYLGRLERIVRRAAREGATLGEIVREPIPDRYSDWGFSFMFPANLERTYRLTRGSRRAPRQR